MSDCAPPLTVLRDVQSEKLRLGGGRPAYRDVLYDNKPCYVVCGDGIAHVGLDYFQKKAYLPLTFPDETADEFEGLQSWLTEVTNADYSTTTPQRIVRDRTVRFKVPLVDGVFDGGIFDERSLPLAMSDIRPGVRVRCAVHASHVYSMGGRTGLVLGIVQMVLLPAPVSRCLIADGDEPGGDGPDGDACDHDYVPFSPKKRRVQ